MWINNWIKIEILKAFINNSRTCNQIYKCSGTFMLTQNLKSLRSEI